MRKLSSFIVLLLMLVLPACQASKPTLTAVVPLPLTSTPTLPPPTAAPTFTSTALPPTPTADPPMQVWVAESVPAGLRSELKFPPGAQMAKKAEAANLRYTLSTPMNGTAAWFFALAAPFPTLADGTSLKDIQAAWAGKPPALFRGHPILLSAATLAGFSALWGDPAESAVQVVEESQISKIAWETRPAFALIPFEQIQASWKVLRVDGKSPLDREVGGYPLVLFFGLQGEPQVLRAAETFYSATPGSLGACNRDSSKLTILVMTGTTALVRATADRIERHGIDYPALDILDWLKDADITHISNEISFYPDCPKPDPIDPRLVFCSNPKYIGLLELIGADVIDLTGNHLNDYGPDWLKYTLDIYQQKGMKTFAAGLTPEEARKPAIFNDHGNQLAFLGCNASGPPNDWVTDTRPGALQCDFDWLEGEVSRLRSEGFLVVVTFQYYESYDPRPNKDQVRDFQRISKAGAAIVSGSQAHRPQALELNSSQLIHYGLGNLFFDQMDTPWTGTRQEFIDRHVFYDGRYLGVELLTAMLEDWARPRPMTAAERTEFLTQMFEVSGWKISGD